MWNESVDVDEPSDWPCRRYQWQEVSLVRYPNDDDLICDALKRFDNGRSAIFIGRVRTSHRAVHEHRRKAAFLQFSSDGGVAAIYQPIQQVAPGGGDMEDKPCSSTGRGR